MTAGMTAGVQPGWPALRTTHVYPLRAAGARPARGRPHNVVTLLSVVEDPGRVVGASHYLTELLERSTGPTRSGPVVVRFTTEDDQVLELLASHLVADVVPAADIDRVLSRYLEQGPLGVLLVACVFQMWPQTLATRRWS